MSRLSLGVSIVLYRTPVRSIELYLNELLEQGAATVYLVDNSPLTFDSFANWQPPANVTVIRTGLNLGYGRANNIAIRDSVLRHRYHIISNPDIRLTPNALFLLYEKMESRPDVGLIMPQVAGPDGARHFLCKRSPAPIDFCPPSLLPAAWRARRRAYFEMRDHPYDREMEVECLSGCFMFMRCSVLERLAGFDERFFMYMEDFDLSRRARRVGRNLYYPGATVVHEHRSAHRHSLRLLRAFGVSIFQFFSKWGWLESAQSREGVR